MPLFLSRSDVATRNLSICLSETNVKRMFGLDLISVDGVAVDFKDLHNDYLVSSTAQLNREF